MVQIFDSWAGNISPVDYDVFGAPYIKRMVDSVKETHPDLPIILYIAGSGGLLERMALTGVDIVSIDQSHSMKDAIQRIGAVRSDNFGVQVCITDLRFSVVICRGFDCNDCSYRDNFIAKGFTTIHNGAAGHLYD